MRKKEKKKKTQKNGSKRATNRRCGTLNKYDDSPRHQRPSGAMQHRLRSPFRGPWISTAQPHLHQNVMVSYSDLETGRTVADTFQSAAAVYS